MPEDGDTSAGPSVDTAFREILEGLRTTLPGVLVLFSFLLALPVQAEFGALSGSEKAARHLAFYGAARGAWASPGRR